MEKERLKEYIEKGFSQRRIAAELGVSQGTVKHYLTKYGLKTFYALGKHFCACGETNPDKFYGHKKKMCGECHNKHVQKKGTEKRNFAIKLLGGKCTSCGFKLWSCSLDIHHLKPEQKDPEFAHMRGWKIERIRKELEGCVLLCKNCHAAVHAGLLKL